MAYTLDELNKMGAAPVVPKTYTVAELQGMGAKPVPLPEPPPENTDSALKGFSKGLAKGEISTFKGLSDIGLKIADQTFGRVVNAVRGKGFTPTNTASNGFDAAVGGADVTKKLTTPETGFEQAGKITEQIAEFLLPSSKILEAEKGLTGLIKGTDLASKAARLGIRAGISGATTGAQATIQNQGEIDDNVKTAALIGTLFPIAGGIVAKSLEGAGGAIGAIGKKIQTSVIKPSIADVKDGFKIENVAKYDLGGGLEDTLVKTNNLMNDLASQLKQKLQDSHIGVNLNTIVDNTISKMTGNKVSTFGNNSAITRVLENLKSEVGEVAGPNGIVDLVDANIVKRGAGTKGSWVFGNPDPDARAVEKVYNQFYNELKVQIEKAAEASGQPGIKEINKQLSDLIPISNAVLRRIPVAERNNALSLGDLISLTGSILDPRALMLTGVNRLSKSGQVGNILMKAGAALKDPEIKNSIMQRFLGKYKNGVKEAAPEVVPAATKEAAPKINMEAGFIKGPNGENVKKILADDKRVMKDFTDYVAGDYKPSEKEAQALELAASRIAEQYNIKNFKSIRGLANEFGRILDDQGLNFGKVAKNPLIIGAAGSAAAVAAAKALEAKKKK